VGTRCGRVGRRVAVPPLLATEEALLVRLMSSGASKARPSKSSDRPPMGDEAGPLAAQIWDAVAEMVKASAINRRRPPLADVLTSSVSGQLAGS
jgi:hypothetical protein